MSIFSHAKAWEEYGIAYAVHKKLWRNCVLATLGPQPDKGDKARDLTGQRNHGTLTGATHLPTWSNHSYRGQSFRAVTFDGSEDYIEYGALLSGSLTRLTLSAWGYRSATTHRMAVGWSITANYRASIFLSGDGNAHWLVENKNPNNQTTAFNGTGWHHFLMTFAGSNTKTAYVDGSNQGCNPSSPASYTVTDTFRIGYHVDNVERYTTGAFAGVQLFTRVLTASEISTLARHPLEAYAVRLPEYFFQTTAGAIALTVAGSALAVTSQNAVLVQHSVLAVGNSSLAVASANVALTQHAALTVQSSQLATTSQSPSLTQHGSLAVGGSGCVVTAGSVSLTQHSVLAVGGAACAISSQSPSLTQHGPISVGSAACAVTADNLTLTDHPPAHVSLTVAGAVCGISSVAPSLIQHSTIAVAASSCIVSSGNVTLAYHSAGVAAIIEHQTLLLAI